VTSHWTAQNGQLLLSNVTAHGTETLRDDGQINVQTPLTPAGITRQYTCSGNTLREYGSDALGRPDQAEHHELIEPVSHGQKAELQL
jgi:hypothetical protein